MGGSELVESQLKVRRGLGAPGVGALQQHCCVCSDCGQVVHAPWRLTPPRLLHPPRLPWQEVLPEFLAAEVVLRTIGDVSQAIAWLRSTYFYVRVKVRGGAWGVSGERCRQACVLRFASRPAGRTVCQQHCLGAESAAIRLPRRATQPPLAPSLSGPCRSATPRGTARRASWRLTRWSAGSRTAWCWRAFGSWPSTAW